MKDIIKRYLNEFKLGTNTMFKEFFSKETNKKQRANMWTFLRLITPFITLILSVIGLITGMGGLLIASGLIAGMGALTDKFDGASARKHNSFTEYGKVLDQVTDKCFAGIIGINLMFLNPAYISILVGELIIAIVNVGYKSKHKDLNISSTMIGKIKQTPLFLSLALGFLSTINPVMLTISNISIFITTIFQLATTISYIENNNRELKKMKKKDLIEFIEDLNQNENNQETENLEKIYENQLSRSEQIEQLQKLKNEYKIEINEKNVSEEKGFQKKLSNKKTD